ncbi:MAG: DEAD/DEAH box helicase, partial [Lentisphaeria bacterium]|nr:DEAD/DEAH box helicase [Lentisphaeria bacterium]
MSTKEEKKTDRGFRLHLRARLRLLKRNLFGSQESGTDEKKTAAPKRGPKAEPRNSGRKKDAKTAPAGKNGARTPETKRQKSKPRNGEGKTASAPAPAKKTRTAKPAVPPMPELTEVPPEEGKVRFTDLPLAKEILAGIQTLGFKYCTPIQALCLPAALEGRDLAAKAQTGTGKTAAFLASCMTRLLKDPLPPEKLKGGACRVLVLSPTRELAIQIHNDALGLGKYTALNNLVIFGGMDHKEQRDSLADPIDILVGTPGRIIDYTQSGHLDLSRVETLVIDEADRMLDMGFIPDVRRIVARLPKAGVRQTMLFSATLEPEILRLVDKWLVDPVSFETEPEHVVTELIDQHFYAVMREEKLAFLLWLIRNEPFERMIIFGNWKERNAELVDKLY